MPYLSNLQVNNAYWAMIFMHVRGYMEFHCFYCWKYGISLFLLCKYGIAPAFYIFGVFIAHKRYIIIGYMVPRLHGTLFRSDPK